MNDTDRELAVQLNQSGREAADSGQRDEAIKAYEQAIAADPSWATPWYNLGLLYKYERSWSLSLECNRKAVSLEPKKEAAIWNLGIAATALGDWPAARQAWRDYGIAVPDGEGPIELACGTAPIRINADGDAEVVWAKRIDPARAVLFSIPYAESGHGYQDLVLNDGAPNGHRMLNGQEVPVFDELQQLERSRFGTFVAQVLLADADFDTERLSEIADALHGAAEDWTTSTRMLCKQCSEGRPHAEHDRAQPADDRNRTVAIAATSLEHARQIVRAWESELTGLSIASLEVALVPGRAAS